MYIEVLKTDPYQRWPVSLKNRPVTIMGAPIHNLIITELKF
jgi:hypothetical protein